MIMFDKIIKAFFGTKQIKDLKTLMPLIHKINSLEPEIMSYSEEDFKNKTAQFRDRYKNGESLDLMLPHAFAMVREAARRMIGERPFDVQLMGGIVLHNGSIMEMKTGEGKTLSSVSAAYLNSLSGKGVHIVTVNDYLAERDANWMKPIYNYLGVTVGSILSEMDNDSRKLAYSKDITYGTNNEFGFDYLRDNMKFSLSTKVQKNHNFCIIDEIDSILIDEARTPLIISGPAEDDTSKYVTVNRLVNSLQECEKDPETGEYPEETEPAGDYKIIEKNKRITFTDEGMNSIEKLLLKNNIITDSLYTHDNFEYIHYFTQCLKAHKLFHNNVDYVVKDAQVQIVDEFTGRILHGRRYSDGLHQAIEAKENIKIAQRNRTLATITFQNFFRMYDKLSGMTGTADTEAKEFARIYNLDVVVIPTNRPLRRIDNDDLIFLTEIDKFNAICMEIEKLNKIGQPILVGTVSIEKSELLSKLLVKRGIRHEVLNAKNHSREAMIIAEAGSKGSVTIATNMAGRGTDIKLGGNPEFRARKKAGTDAGEEVFEKIYKEEFKIWQEHYNEVKNLGGLHILGTERHESRRIDNQLRGRSGRQGDPGSSRFFISLDDTLMRLFGGDRLKGLMSGIGMNEGDPIMHPWINKSIEKAQTRVEDKNFEIRKHLLEFDDVLNTQRNFIYSKRDEILGDENILERVFETFNDAVSDYCNEYLARDDRNFTPVLLSLKEDFFYSPDIDDNLLNSFSPSDFKDFLLSEIRKDLEQKQNSLTINNFNTFVRFEYIKKINSKWLDHLEHLSSLRDAVHLRAYAQKNPLLEYKLEGFQIFDSMLTDIRTNIAKKVLNIKITSFEGKNYILEQSNFGNARHRNLGQFNAPQSATAQASRPRNVQVKRTVPKVGRNDQCPCGSGKKYKHCHGR